LMLLIAAAFAVILGIYRAIPPVKFSKYFPNRGLEIELVVGDILDPKATHHIAVLSSDYFDSCVETAISKRSLKGQLIANYFDDVKSRFDSQIDLSLNSQLVSGVLNTSKKRGVNRTMQFPIGTTAEVSIGVRKAIVTVGANFDDSTSKTSTSAEALWRSLLGVWSAALTFGHRNPLAIPIWGANLGNAPGNRLVLFQTLLCSFAACTASQHQPPTKHLVIVIWPGDYHPQEFKSMTEVLRKFEL
jgi:hypothetical protein